MSKHGKTVKWKKLQNKKTGWNKTKEKEGNKQSKYLKKNRNNHKNTMISKSMMKEHFIIHYTG